MVVTQQNLYHRLLQLLERGGVVGITSRHNLGMGSGESGICQGYYRAAEILLYVVILGQPGERIGEGREFEPILVIGFAVFESRDHDFEIVKARGKRAGRAGNAAHARLELSKRPFQASQIG